MNLNPVLSEIQGLSPAAQAALGMAGHTLPDLVPAPAMPHVSPPNDPGLATPRVTAGPAPAMSPLHMDEPAPILNAPSQPNVSGPIRGTLQGDQLERQRLLQAGSGESQIASRIEGTGFGKAHPILGRILGGAAQGAATVGDIGLSAVAPQIAATLPGTEYHHLELQRGADKQVGEDEANQEKEAQTANIGATTAHTDAETAGMPQKEADEHTQSQATVGNLESETNLRDHPLPNLAAGHAYAVDKAIKEGRDPATDPLVQHYEKAITSTVPGFNKPNEAPKTITAVRPGAKGPHEYGWNPKTNAYDIDEGEHFEKAPVVNVNAGVAALDRESKQFGTPHQKAVTDANTQLEKIEDARNMINGNAESQALGVPKVLTALVSGAGSGVRITQPELNAIAKARGIGGDVEGTLSSLGGKGKLTTEQQRQLTGILDDVKNRILQKQSIASDALDRINGAGSREEIIQADKEARQKLGDMERGGANPGAPGANSGLAVSLADARQLPQYKGKTDDQIKADIIKFGHTVRP